MSKTREIIERLLEFNSKLTNTQICKATGLSRQLVSYHTRRMKLTRQSANRSCWFCGRRITRYNASGLCKRCRPISYTYEYRCAWCKEVYTCEGHEAAQRRNSKKYKKNPDLDFCTSKCSGKYYFHRGNSLTNIERDDSPLA